MLLKRIRPIRYGSAVALLELSKFAVCSFANVAMPEKQSLPGETEFRGSACPKHEFGHEVGGRHVWTGGETGDMCPEAT